MTFCALKPVDILNILLFLDFVLSNIVWHLGD